jgi:hypothetical protein
VVNPSVVITVPMMPPRECSPNFHGHWSVMSKARAEFREAAYYATLALSGADKEWVFMRYGKPTVLDVAVAWCCGRKRMDDDNLIAAIKSARDGIVDGAHLSSDRDFVTGTVTQTRGDGVTILTLREVE